ncbi:ATP-binding cassette domain-containing protein [Sanguibacter massiliensis]|uniref:ATP-binding cassette domain-containing protein n=1 Tax=Sanguibacter massiliensis TaxID=1973217 RepID=UPI001F5CFF7D|nr:ATP-binding cassette domain-containing protein [Sanguibacter massiliensis]
MTRRYRDFTLGPVSAELGVGVTALLGANGAGKSTLIRVLVGTEAPTSGTVRLSGARVAPHGAIGYLPQDFVGPKNVPTRDYLSFVAWCRSSRRRRLTGQDVDEALERVGLHDKAATRIGALSGGMVRRLGVAQAILGGVDLLVLDEPTVGLDPMQRAELRALITDLSRDTVVVMSTHLCEDVAAVASWVHVLAEGELRYDGPTVGLVEGVGLVEISTEAVEKGFLSAVHEEVAWRVA